MATSLKQLVESYDPKLLLGEASTPPNFWYSDSRVLELEQRTVFSLSWQMVGRAQQLRKPGQYITCDLAGEPILLVTGHDGVIRGFYNVCRHHAAAVLTEPQGRVEHLRCPYHGWTYNLEGALLVAPEFGGVRNFDKSGNGLVPVETAIWQGWVFVKLVASGPRLEEFLGKDLTERVRNLRLEQLCWFERRSYTVKCNWKVFIDNYLDGGYHVPHIHGALSSVLDYSAYRIETGDRFCLQSSPIVSGKTDAQTSETRKGHALYCWIYPNFMINWYEGVMDTNLVVAICESVQRGLSSRSYSTGRLSVRREAGEHLFHKLLHADMKMGLLDPAA